MKREFDMLEWLRDDQSETLDGNIDVKQSALWDIKDKENTRSAGSHQLYYVRGLILAKMRRFQEAEISIQMAVNIREAVFGVKINQDTVSLKYLIEIYNMLEMWKHQEVLQLTKAFFQTTESLHN